MPPKISNAAVRPLIVAGQMNAAMAQMQAQMAQMPPAQREQMERVDAEHRAEAVRALATFFLRWFMPQIVFYGVGAVATGLLNAHRRFAAPMDLRAARSACVSGAFRVGATSPMGAGEPR